ncbi:MAG: hypothetical protein H6502_01895 [Candidatus Woesearchaeota archaeon]|nr:MAG: hypothetical protein H6502_01895 [Candidatus Woesearchaeota archaeon]
MKRVDLFQTLVVTSLALFIIAFALAVNFSTLPSISPSTPTTRDNIICSWKPSIDTVQQNVTWYNGSSPYTTVANIPFTDNRTTLLSYIAQRGERWSCNVTLWNGSTSATAGKLFTINNSLPNLPNATDELLTEDVVFQTQLSAFDPDGDALTFLETDGTNYCDISGAGLVTCIPLAAHIGDTNFTFYVKDDTPSLLGITVTYTVAEVNDQAYFLPNLTNQQATEDITFNYSISGFDEEGDEPFTFNMSTDLASIIFVQSSNTEGYVTFNRPSNAPQFADRGLWTVYMNISDNASLLPPVETSFTINVSAVNQLPQITSNLVTPDTNQSDLFTFYINASDADVADNITFTITPRTCSLSNPWSFTTLVNGSNASIVINQIMTNDHVACRNVRIRVTDDHGGYTENNVTFNILNLNDAPVIYELTDGIYNLSNFTWYVNATFSSPLNYSDVDQLTYAGDTLTFSTNHSNFTINSTSGEFNFTVGPGLIGNYLFEVYVDDGEAITTAIANITIRNNSVPVMTVSLVNYTQGILGSSYFTAIDRDGDNLTWSFAYEAGFNASNLGLVQGNMTLYWMNFTPTNAQVGNKTLNVSVCDLANVCDYEVLSFEIGNANDAPIWDNNQDNVSDAINFGILVEDVLYENVFYATDIDFFVLDDNLTFNFAFTGASPTGFAYSKTDVNEVTVSFVPQSGEYGVYEANASVTDAGGLVDWQLVNITIYNESVPPQFTQVTPFMSNTSLNTSWFVVGGLTNITINFSENATVTFDALATNDTTQINNNISYRWYVDGVQKLNLPGVDPGVNSNYTRSFNFSTAGTHDIVVSATDAYYSTANFSWNITIANLNRPPVFYGPLDNFSVSQTTALANYFIYRNSVQRFYDADDDTSANGLLDGAESSTLNFSLAYGESCSVATLSITDTSLTITPTSLGYCDVVFNATDDAGAYVSSNTVRIVITNVPDPVIDVQTSNNPGGTRTVTTTVTVPFQEEVDSPEPFSIVVSDVVAVYENDTVTVPITVVNTWDDSLYGINFNAIAGSENVTVTFSEDYVASLGIGQNASTLLTLGNYRTSGTYEIVVNVTTDDPVASDSATIHINSLEKSTDDEEAYKVKVTFARDLLASNPACAEMNELLTELERRASSIPISQALTELDNIINGCKYLIDNEKNEINLDSPRGLFSMVTLTDLLSERVVLAVGGVIAITILMMIVSYVRDRWRNRKYN